MKFEFHVLNYNDFLCEGFRYRIILVSFVAIAAIFEKPRFNGKEIEIVETFALNHADDVAKALSHEDSIVDIPLGGTGVRLKICFSGLPLQYLVRTIVML